MKVVIAGGTGLVGSAVAREFANAGQSVLIENTYNVNLIELLLGCSQFQDTKK